jgi:hypothetical protein
MEASINMTIKAGDKSYAIKLEIPSGARSNDAPYTFSVSESGDTTDKLLDLAVGADSNFYVNLAPPKTALPSSGTVENLAVTVEEGTYDTSTNKFTT